MSERMRTTSYRHVHACVDLCWVLRVDECLIQFSNGCEWNGVKQILHTCFGIHVRPGENQDEKSVADQRTNPHFTTFITLLTPKRCSWPNNFYKRWVGPCLSPITKKHDVTLPAAKVVYSHGLWHFIDTRPLWPASHQQIGTVHYQSLGKNNGGWRCCGC